jgi:hypothetical protein
VEHHPQDEWANRIGDLQMVNGGGQVFGLLLAAALSRYSLNGALLIAAGLTALAVLPGRLTPQTAIARRRPQPLVRGHQPHLNYRRRFYFRQVMAIIDPIHDLSPAFKRLMAVWLLCLTGSAALFTLYPVMMQESLGIGQRFLSLVFAIALGSSLFLYPQAAHSNRQFGSPGVLKFFLGVRLVAFMGLFASLCLKTKNNSGFASICFIVIVMCWPFLGISATALTAKLSNYRKGGPIGVFKAVSALTCVMGSALGGCLASWWGEVAATGLFVVTEAMALTLLMRSHLSP